MTRKERAELREAMRAYKAEGHTMSEAADRFGYNKSYVNQVCKGIAPQQAQPIQYRNQYTNGKFDREANIIKCITERAPNFEYAGEFTGVDGFVNLKCKTCGTVLRKSCVSVRHGHATCEECARRKSAERKRLEQLQKQKEQEERERARWINASCTQTTMTVCECCGSLFVSTGRMKYCSSTCRKRINNAIKKDRRIRKIRHVVVDKNITLERLYDRDNGRCYICGRVCDWDDYTIEHDVFIAYNNYPSIDHIVPLSKGGKHEWSNVMLACRGCNSKKSDNLPLPCLIV